MQLLQYGLRFLLRNNARTVNLFFATANRKIAVALEISSVSRYFSTCPDTKMSLDSEWDRFFIVTWLTCANISGSIKATETCYLYILFMIIEKKMIFDLEAGNLGDGSSPIEIRLVNVDRIFSRVNNIKILQRNLVECNNNTVLVGNPRFFV